MTQSLSLEQLQLISLNQTPTEWGYKFWLFLTFRPQDHRTFLDYNRSRKKKTLERALCSNKTISNRMFAPWYHQAFCLQTSFLINIAMEQSHGFITRITWYSLERTLQFFNWCRCRLPGEGGVEKGNKKCGKPSTSTPKRTSSAQAPSSCQPTPGPQYWRRTDVVKIRGNKTMVIAGNKLSTYIVALVLGPKQGPASLLHLLGHSHHARCNIPEHTKGAELQKDVERFPLYATKTYWVLQFLQVTTSTTQEDSQVNLSLSFTP